MGLCECVEAIGIDLSESIYPCSECGKPLDSTEWVEYESKFYCRRCFNKLNKEK